MGASNAFSTVPQASAQPGELFVSAVPREGRARAKPLRMKSERPEIKAYSNSEDALAWTAIPSNQQFDITPR